MLYTTGALTVETGEAAVEDERVREVEEGDEVTDMGLRAEEPIAQSGIGGLREKGLGTVEVVV